MARIRLIGIVYQVGLNYAVSARNLKESSDIASKLGKLLK